MEAYICETCAVQFAPSDGPPKSCPVCEDERQYVGMGGQKWTTMKVLKAKGRNAFQKFEEDLYGIATEPKVGIGQRALLVRTPEGNLLWDCISLLDDATVDIVKALGGLRGIAISHLHYYSSMVDWSRAFGDVPIYIHLRDKEWIEKTRPDALPENGGLVKFWGGPRQELWGGLSLHHLGGHFAGAFICHWPQGAQGKGALFTGDILQVNPDLKTVSVMRSYPCLIPLSEATTRRIKTKVEDLPPYDRVYGAFWWGVLKEGAREKVTYSMERALKWLTIDNEAVA